MRKKFFPLESLRGLAALSVALYHFNIGNHLEIDFVNNSWLMVDFFFVLSGFVISLSYQDRIRTKGELYSFQKKRFFRLYPLHITMLIIFVGVEILKYFVEFYFDMVADNQAFSLNDTYSFIANALLVHNWVLPALTWNYPSWSISAEFYTYLIYGLITVLWASHKEKSMMVTACAVLLIILSGVVLFWEGFNASNISGPSRCIFSFFLGVLTYNFYRKSGKHIQFQNSYVAILMLCASVISVILLGGISKSSNLLLVFPFVFAATIYSVVVTTESTWVNKILSKPVLVYLGGISYGIYMIHVFVWYVFIQIGRFIFKYPTKVNIEGKATLVLENPYLADLITLFGILCIIGLSHLSYKYIETRFSRKAA